MYKVTKESSRCFKCSKDKETNMDILPSGNELVRTGQHYVKILNEELGLLDILSST